MVHALLVLMLSAAHAQVWQNPCKDRPELRADMDRDVLDMVGNMEGPDFVAAIASSRLAPSGEAPPLPPRGDDVNRHRARDLWSCTHGATQLIDGDPRTAWVEGVDGNGEGELVMVELQVDRPMEIWSGDGKSSALHATNSRPRQVEVSVFERGEWEPATPGSYWKNNRLVARHTVELRDHNGYQPLPLPELPSDRAWTGPVFVVVRIRSVYPGSRSTHTVISEIRNR